MTCLINHQLPGNSIKLKLSPPLPWFLRSQRYPYFIEWIVAWTGASACDGKDKSINGIKIRIPMPGVGPVLASSLLKLRKLNNLVRVIMIFAALCMQTEHVTRHGRNLIMNQVTDKDFVWYHIGYFTTTTRPHFLPQEEITEIIFSSAWGWRMAGTTSC